MSEQAKIVWTVTVRRMGWLRWEWRVLAPVSPPNLSTTGGKPLTIQAVAALGETLTRRGAENAAKHWVKNEVLKRDSRYTMRIET
jgi:hypothetical protein